jgi:hypothetical protein
MVDTGARRTVDGLLGMDFLTTVGAVVDVEKREIRVKE